MKAETIQSVKDTYAAAIAAGQKVEINPYLPTISVEINEDESYFFQGEEAENLLNEVEGSELSEFCSINEIILYQAQGW